MLLLVFSNHSQVINCLKTANANMALIIYTPSFVKTYLYFYLYINNIKCQVGLYNTFTTEIFHVILFLSVFDPMFHFKMSVV